MKPEIKKMIREYLDAIDINTVRKDLRIPLIKECISKLTILDEINVLHKMRLLYPMIGTTEPIKIKK